MVEMFVRIFQSIHKLIFQLLLTSGGIASCWGRKLVRQSSYMEINDQLLLNSSSVFFYFQQRFRFWFLILDLSSFINFILIFFIFLPFRSISRKLSLLYNIYCIVSSIIFLFSFADVFCISPYNFCELLYASSDKIIL